MKIKTLVAILLCTLSLSTFAQNNDLRLNIGIPLGKYGKFDHKFAGSNESNYPSILIQLEKEWQDNFSIGAYIGYAGQKHEYDFGHSETNYNYYRLGSVLTYELNDWLSDMNISTGYDVDLYTSVKAGISLEHKKYENTSPNASSNPVYSHNSSNDLLFDLGVVLGARYHFSNQFGLFTEIGWANAGFLTIGTSFTL
ncbi:outer membrane beta-barrel protein [Marinifilum sp. D737]|uniref:outer membrane beta-barrel protein n=1 Tax=Marinifilum sp. D737 TaxID=2969628 RepID=UPI00227252CF|nr:outer membrane beta-barrel protein [Marinifilum sp. D737]MCY1636031.1 porin family protein [Marinifilum sp. D737]